MRAALAAGRVARLPERLSMSVHLPILCSAAVSPDRSVPFDMATATALLWAGLELYDDCTDGDLPGWLCDRADYEIVFTAFALACLLPASLIGELQLPGDCRAALQRQLSLRLLRAFAGQQADLGHARGASVSPAGVLKAVQGKNGEPCALFAEMGAIAAGAPESVVEAYERFGRSLGTVTQLQSDFWELFHDSEARDLVQGNRTYIIATALERTPGPERSELIALLDQARTDRGVHAKLRERLERAEILMPWRSAVQGAVAEGLAALAAAGPAEPAGAILRSMLEDRSPFC